MSVAAAVTDIAAVDDLDGAAAVDAQRWLKRTREKRIHFQETGAADA